MDNFNLKKFLSEKSLLNENAPGYDTRKFGEALPTLESVKAAHEGKINEDQEIFSDEELDYIGDMMTAMYEKLGLDAGEGETDVAKALALSDRIEGFFQSLQ